MLKVSTVCHFEWEIIIIIIFSISYEDVYSIIIIMCTVLLNQVYTDVLVTFLLLSTMLSIGSISSSILSIESVNGG